MMDNSIICCLVKSGGLFVDIVYTIFIGDIKIGEFGSQCKDGGTF